MANKLREAALAYARKFGWAVFPLHPGAKIPHGGTNGVLDATTDPEKIRTWWERWPNSNIGLATGKSRLVVIDLDTKNGVNGLETWAELEAELNFHADTVTNLTPSGGQHLLFAAPIGVDIPPSAGKLGPGVDVRAGNSYIVLPPSTQGNGKPPYTWELSSRPGECPIAPLPEPLLKLLINEGQGKPQAAPPLPDVIPVGQRNITLTSLAGSMRRRGASEAAILAALEEENTRCDPSLPRTELERIAKSVARYPSAVKECEHKETKQRRKSQTDRIIELALATSLELFLDGNGEPHASIPVERHREVCALNTRRFKWWLRCLLYRADRKAAYDEAIRGAVGVLAGMAAFAENPTKQTLYNRVAWGDDGALWYDLADEQWRAIRITPDGWQIVENPPHLFRRFKHQSPQVIPEYVPVDEAAEELDRLRKYARLNDPKLYTLEAAYLGTCYVPDIAHPIPHWYGPQGAGKSVTSRVFRSLIDPSQALCSLSRKEDDLVQMLDHNWTAYFDNVTYLTDWQQDLLCRACTGQGFSKRRLYTDDEDVIYSFKRCVGLNGIDVMATRGDLLDRSIIFQLERIENRKPEAELWAEFEQDRPRILGAIFATLSAAMKQDEGTANAMAAYFRMADFVGWAYRFLNALDGSGDAFLNIYAEHIKARSAVAIEAHPLGAAILAFMQGKDQWEGKPSELLSQLNKVAIEENIDTDSKVWPKSAVWLTRRLNEVKTDLAEMGIKIVQEEGGDRTLTLTQAG